MPVADYSVHSEATLEGALAAIRRILFHREQQHTTWPDEANLALGQFADLIREVKSYREDTLERVELTSFGESIVAAAGSVGVPPAPANNDPGDETDAIPFGTLETRPGSGPLPLTIEQQHNLLRADGHRQSALRSVYSVCTLITDEDNFGIDAAVQFAYAMKEVAEQALAYTGEIPTPANPRPE